jgi:hypothetical protein
MGLLVIPFAGEQIRISNAQMTQFGFQAMGNQDPVGVEMLGMVRASQCANI